MTDLLKYERELAHKGFARIGGIDEVGRGPLAGPVVVAGVVLPLGDDEIIEGVNDSKKLSEKKRELLYDKIMEKACSVYVAYRTNEQIDSTNILIETKSAMVECANEISADVVIVDAVEITANKPTVSVIHGDALSYSVAAASIVAKVTRDRLMCKYATQYPEYGFEKHKGYGTALHVEMLKKHGPCPLHRKSFIKNFFKDEQ